MKKSFVSPLAGLWYPGDAAVLRRELTDYLQEKSPDSGICGLIVPHAGYRFSGQVAGTAYRLIDSAVYDRVVILAPSHYAALADAFSLPDVSGIETPLGLARFDDPVCEALRRAPRHRLLPTHREEHSHQIQLPFLQLLFGEDLRVVPVLVGELTHETRLEIAATLLRALPPRTLIVVSTDFTHYGSRFGYAPFRSDIQEKIETLDSAVYEGLAADDEAAFDGLLEQTRATVCGRHPLSLLFHLFQGKTCYEKTAYDTSGRMLDEVDSVSYLSAVIRREGAQAALSVNEHHALLQWARLSLMAAVSGQPLPEKPPFTLTPPLLATRGAFVTLNTREGHLRGCIGEILPRRPLWLAVRDRARNAALEDPRFHPVTSDEARTLRIEISALTPPRPVLSWKEIVAGRHGVVLSVGAAGAVFLPQVAPEQGWGVEEMLTHLSRKAGLPADAWKWPQAKFEVFEAEVFGEK